MALYVVATPIGNDEDLGQRAARLLREADLIIGEEYRVTSRFLKKMGLETKNIELLNEHSKKEDLLSLSQKAQKQKVVLISDCGTPGFCDPGAELVALCQKLNIPIHSVPGPSSLMAFLSICGYKLKHFLFIGFLPANREERAVALKNLVPNLYPMILMDTPYRLHRLLQDLEQYFPTRSMTLGLNLSCDDEKILTGTVQQIQKKIQDHKLDKAEFLILIQGK